MLITVLRSFSIKLFYEIELGMKIIFSSSTFEVMLEKIITFSFLFFANNYSRKYLLGMCRMERSNFKYDYKMGNPEYSNAEYIITNIRKHTA